MKILKSLILSTLLLNSGLYATVNPPTIYFQASFPAKTVFIKHPAAANPAVFFTNPLINFEVYKTGSPAETTRILNVFKQDPNVQSCTEGPLTGDYQAFIITLKSPKDKNWFATLFKKAGLNHIKINNNPVVEVDKM